MNVLLLGSGGREHALAWAIAKSPVLEKLYCAPGNGGIAAVCDCVPLDLGNHAAVVEFCRSQDINLVVVGPEVPLVAGLVDDLDAAGILAFGPSRAAAQLEGSKGFTKDLCAEFNIPTAAFGHFTNPIAAKHYTRKRGAPIVVKADGLAAGKGVTMARTLDEALGAINDCFAGAFGEAGAEVVVEEWMTGEEASLFVLTDGKTLLPLATAQDHKRAFDGDKGPNTGGMGAYSPAPVMSDEMIARAMKEIIAPTVEGLAQRGTPFKGVLYAGLMITSDGPRLIEYNVRFGDPECQVIMMRLAGDLLPALHATATGTLNDIELSWHDDAALCVVMAANGYPESYDKGSAIDGLEAAAGGKGVEIFHAGTKLDDGAIVSNGGRVLNICACGTNVRQAQSRAYAAVDAIDWRDGFNRNDIGWRAIERETDTDKT